MASLQELLTDQLRDLYDAEKQLTRALPKMAKAATNPELKTAFTEHLEVTQNQIARLEQAFEKLGEKAKSKPCKGMKGLVEEGQEHMGEHPRGPMRDAAIIGAAERVEHYEVAGYTCARATAKLMGNREVVALLQETLKEEEQTGKLLLQIGDVVQREIQSGEAEEEDEEESAPRGRKGAGKSAGKSAGKTATKGAAKSAGKSEGSGAARKGGARGGRGGGNGSRGGGNDGGGESSGAAITSTDHEEIRQWAEERGAKPACVKGTGKRGDTGMIRLDFPGYSGGDSLQEISWEDWFEKFDEQGLALLHQETTAAGEQSNFNKLVAREGAGARGGSGGGRKGAGKKTAGRKR